MNTEFQINPMQPIDYIAWLALIIVIAVSVYALYSSVKKYSQQRAQESAAYELVDRTFANTWNGDRQLEFYAWSVTAAKLVSHKNPFVRPILKERIEQSQARNRPVASTQRETLWLARPTI